MLNMKQRGFEKITNCEVNKGVILPKRSTKNSAGYDFFLPYDLLLKVGESIVIETGIKVYMLYDEVLKIYPRSSWGFKYLARIANTVGIIDSDYYNNPKNEGHIMIKLTNTGDKDIIAVQGEAFCQGIFQKYLITDKDSFFEGNDRIGGIGSTDQQPIKPKFVRLKDGREGLVVEEGIDNEDKLIAVHINDGDYIDIVSKSEVINY